MGMENVQDWSASNAISGGSGETDNGSDNNELECAAEKLTRVELDLACCSEKLANLGILVMHLGSRESDFEAFALGEEDSMERHVEKALEFDFLYGFVDCEIQELESLLCALQADIVRSSESVSSFMHLGDALKQMEEKIQDCTESLNRSFQQALDIKEQCGYFKRILCAYPGSEGWKEGGEPYGLENGDLPKSHEKIKLQTAQQQRNVLRMLEKSLAREMDLEKKLVESRQTEEDLKHRLQQEANYMEQEVEDLSRRLFDSENTKEVIFGFLKEFQERVTEAERRAENAESESKSLKASNLGLNKDVNRMKDELLATTGKVQQLEGQLKVTESRLLHAVAAAEAGREMQSMSDQTIKDMDRLIQDLKFKVSRAEAQTESTEDKCILLSETNAELTEVINHLRCRVEDLETSLCSASDAKKQYGEDIKVQIKLIADLIVKLANERERLHQEVLSLRKEKKLAFKDMQQKNKSPSSETQRHDSDTRDVGNITTSTAETTEEICSSTRHQSGLVPKSSSTADEASFGNSPADSKADAVRDIDARQLQFLSLKHIIRGVLLLCIPIFCCFTYLSAVKFLLPDGSSASHNGADFL